MINRYLLKKILREMRAAPGRVIAIFTITALGAGFFAGLRATAPDMRNTADAYYAASHLADYRLIAPIGFTEEDVETLAGTNWVSASMPGQMLDMLVAMPDSTPVVRLHSLPQDTSPENANYLNRLTVVEGRLPAGPSECVVDTASEFAVGDVLRLSPDNDEERMELFITHTFVVVGLVESPEYIAFQRGNTNIGGGRISFFAYLPDAAFDSEFYTALYLRDADAEGLSSFSPAYEAITDNRLDTLEEIAQERTLLRYDEIYEEAAAELADARQELADGRAEADAEFADAWQEIVEGQADIADGWRELRENEQTLRDGEAQLASGEARLATARTELASGETQYADGLAQYEAGLAQYNAGRAQLDEQEALYQAGRRQLDAGIAQYNQNNAAYAQQRAAYDAGVAALDNLRAADAGLSALSQQLNALWPQIGSASTPAEQQAEADFTAAASGAIGALNGMAGGLAAQQDPALQTLGAALAAAAGSMQTDLDNQQYQAVADTLAATLPQIAPALAAMQAWLDKALPALNQAEADLAVVKAQLDDAVTVADENRAQLDAAEAASAKGKADLDASAALLAASRRQLDDGWAQLTAGESELASARSRIADGWRQWEEGRETLLDAERELADGKQEYFDKRAEVMEELADAQEEIDSAQADLDDFEVPEWLIFDRTGNPAYSGFESDSSRIGAIADVIPTFFFLVAALVCLTSMTRMVEEQRTQIGTLKALGMGKGAIAFKFLLYAGFISIAGSVVGVIIGYVVFPPVIWEAYGMMYIMPDLVRAGHFWLTVVTIGAMFVCNTAATLAACLGELRSAPANLMRYKSPKAGKRVLLERARFIWKRLPFSWKVTVRNLFLYKKRFFMTVIGVAGCTALLITGFGLRDSISGVLPKQYGEINLYNIMATLIDPADAEGNTSLNRLLPTLGEYEYVQQIAIDAASDRGNNNGMTTYLFIPEDADDITHFIDFHERASGAAIAFPEDGVLITEKLANRLAVHAGDTIRLSRGSESPVEVQVAGVMENYLLNYIYIAPDTYQTLFGEAPAFDMVLLKVPGGEAAEEAALHALIEESNVAGAVDLAQLKGQLDDMLQGINSVIWVILLSAGTLAMVVLYNLSNVNITERMREIATLKVLGFYDREVNAYVFRENVMLTLIGILVGFVLGLFLHRFVILTAEVDEMMFGRVVGLFSYVFSAVFTLAAAGLVNVVMVRKLRSIDMVESLKSNE